MNSPATLNFPSAPYLLVPERTFHIQQHAHSRVVPRTTNLGRLFLYILALQAVIVLFTVFYFNALNPDDTTVTPSSKPAPSFVFP